MEKFVKFDENFYLITQTFANTSPIEVVKSVNHIIIIDVSGSMSYDLPEMRKSLKNRLSNLVKPEDTVTIIYFSGRNEAGILKEAVSVKSLKQLTELNEAIDRFLKPIGLTAFAKPIELAEEVINRIHSTNPNSIFSLIFMSDGYNNDTSWENVVKASQQISSKLSSSVVVEYGYNADSKRLTEIAGILGGSKINAVGFEEYDVVIENGLSKSFSGGKKITVEISDNHMFDFVFSVSKDGDILLYNIVDNKVMVNSDVAEIHFFADYKDDNEVINQDSDSALYAAIYVLSDRLQNDLAEKIFYALGDNYYYQMISNAFGKQKLNAFKTSIKECVGDITKRFPNGKSQIEKVDENTYCLMNLISDLGNIDNCLFFPNHPEFEYDRIGRKRIERGSALSGNDKQRLSEAKNIEEANLILQELKEKNVDLKFINSFPNKGYSITDLVWNEERANLSVRIRIDGKVVLPDNKFINISEVNTYKWRTFTLIKDGIVNVEKLPLLYSTELEKLCNNNKIKYSLDYDYNGVLSGVPYVIIIDITSLPIINKAMVKFISADKLAELEFKLVKQQADKKVFDFYRKSLFPKTSESLIVDLEPIFGVEKATQFADWLKSIGITDYNGFAPKTDFEESTDFYMSVNLAVKIKGLSTLPKVEDVVAKLKDNKPLKLNELLLSYSIKNYQQQLESDLFKSLNEEQQKEILKNYLIKKSDELNIVKRKTAQEIAQIKFSLILSKKWFIEFKSFDENKLIKEIDGQNLEFTFELSEKEVKI